MNYQIPKGYSKVLPGSHTVKGDVAIVWNDGKASMISLHARRGGKVKADEIVLRRAR
jgi:hypothetical protein